MHIVEYENYQIQPTQEALLIGPIRKLYNADKTKTKEKFLQLMSVLYFYVDPRSSYSYITDDQERLKEIIIQEGLPKDFKIDKILQEAIDIYKKHTITSSYLLLQDTKIAIDKVFEPNVKYSNKLNNLCNQAREEKAGLWKYEGFEELWKN